MPWVTPFNAYFNTVEKKKKTRRRAKIRESNKFIVAIP